MSQFDLTNKNISDTFQNLLQKTGSEGLLYDLSGNIITDLTISGSINITSSLILGGGTFTSESLAAAQAGGDNLGSHIATTELKMAGFSIENANHITASGHISTSLSSTGSFGHLMVGGGNFTSASLAAGGSGGGGSDNLGNHTATQDLDMATYDIKGITHITASGNISGSSTSTGSFGRLQLHTGSFGNGILRLSPINTNAEFYMGLSGGGTFSIKTGGTGIIFDGGTSISYNGNIKADAFKTHRMQTFSNQKDLITFSERAAGSHRWGTTFIGSENSPSPSLSPTSDTYQLSVSPESGSIGVLYLKASGSSTNQTGDMIRVVDKDDAHLMSVDASGNISASGNLNIEGHITASGNISASSLELNSVNATDDFFLLKSGSLTALKLNNEGVLQLGAFTFTPTAVSGGMYYDKTDDEFYLGKENN